MDWTEWAAQRPTDTTAIYRWRVGPRKICGMMLRPEWSGKMSLCGMGYRDNEYWPPFSHWNGATRSVPNDTEWRFASADETTIFWGGLDLLPSPFTGRPPVVEYSGRWIGAPPTHPEYLILKSYLVDAHFDDARRMMDTWNLRA